MRKILLMTVTILLLTVLAACGGEAGNADGGNAAGAGGQSEQGENVPVRLAMGQEAYPAGTKEISGIISNDTEKTVEVVLIPKLERKTAEDWEPVECVTGFCGTPDGIEPGGRTVSLPIAEWFPSTTTGAFRLSYDGQDADGKAVVLTAEFTIGDQV